MKTSVKIQETHLITKKNGVLQKFPAKRRLGEDGDKEEEKNWEGERSLHIFFLFSPLIGLYMKRKAKSKKIFDFGRTY